MKSNLQPLIRHFSLLLLLAFSSCDKGLFNKDDEIIYHEFSPPLEHYGELKIDIDDDGKDDFKLTNISVPKKEYCGHGNNSGRKLNIHGLQKKAFICAETDEAHFPLHFLEGEAIPREKGWIASGTLIDTEYCNGVGSDPPDGVSYLGVRIGKRYGYIRIGITRPLDSITVYSHAINDNRGNKIICGQSE